jgi:lipid A 3-O-deacylase
MRHKLIIIFILLGLLSVQLLAQAEKKDIPGTYSFCFENDTFAGTDRCFTGGWKLGWMSKNLENYRENPLLKWLPFVNKPGFQHSISMAIGQNIYTPDDISSVNLIPEDHPYAGILFLAFGIHSISSFRMDTLEINLGIVGPHSYAEQMQKFVHKLVKAVQPEGWHHQLKDEITLEAIYERKWKLIRPQSGSGFGYDLIPHFGWGLGNVYIYASTGMQMRLGWNLPGDFGANLIRPGGDCSVSFRRSGKFGVHFFAAVDGKAVLRNIFLDGNTFQDSHRVDKRPFTLDILLGMSLRVGRFNFSYAYVFWTRKYKTETRRQVFASLNLSYSY